MENIVIAPPWQRIIPIAAGAFGVLGALSSIAVGVGSWTVTAGVCVATILTLRSQKITVTSSNISQGATHIALSQLKGAGTSSLGTATYTGDGQRIVISAISFSRAQRERLAQLLADCRSAT